MSTSEVLLFLFQTQTLVVSKSTNLLLGCPEDLNLHAIKRILEDNEEHILMRMAYLDKRNNEMCEKTAMVKMF